MPVHATLADALVTAANDLLRHGQRVTGVMDPRSIGSSYGTRPRPFRELIGYTFTITDPLAVLIGSSVRPVNIPYLLANLLWVTSGSDQVRDIEYWNGRATTFSDDGSCIRSAAGPRLFRTKGQFTLARNRLMQDSNSRRAMVLLIEPADLAVDTRDVPCMATLQFLLRDGQLHAVGTMRSQSALMVMPYDIALFAGLQCLMAVELGADIGTYTHFAGSFHFYEEEEAVAQGVATGDISGHRMPMPCGLGTINELIGLLTRLPAASRVELREIASSALVTNEDPFLNDVACVLTGAALDKRGEANTARQLWSRAGALGKLCLARRSASETN